MAHIILSGHRCEQPLSRRLHLRLFPHPLIRSGKPIWAPGVCCNMPKSFNELECRSECRSVTNSGACSRLLCPSYKRCKRYNLSSDQNIFSHSVMRCLGLFPVFRPKLYLLFDEKAFFSRCPLLIFTFLRLLTNQPASFMLFSDKNQLPLILVFIFTEHYVVIDHKFLVFKMRFCCLHLLRIFQMWTEDLLKRLECFKENWLVSVCKCRTS